MCRLSYCRVLLYIALDFQDHIFALLWWAAAHDLNKELKETCEGIYLAVDVYVPRRMTPNILVTLWPFLKCPCQVYFSSCTQCACVAVLHRCFYLTTQEQTFSATLAAYMHLWLITLLAVVDFIIYIYWLTCNLHTRSEPDHLPLWFRPS